MTKLKKIGFILNKNIYNDSKWVKLDKKKGIIINLKKKSKKKKKYSSISNPLNMK